LGRLTDPDQFGNIVVKQSNNSVVRVKDIARVELAGLDYGVNSYLDKTAPSSRYLPVAGVERDRYGKYIKQTMVELSEKLSPASKYDIIYNPTDFIQQSVNAVVETIFEAIVLVVLVVILFLQTWRAAIIPIVAIPVSLVGTFFLMALFGFSLNNLSLFASCWPSASSSTTQSSSWRTSSATCERAVAARSRLSHDGKKSAPH